MRLQGRVALVTGAASGIGKAVVERFCSEGASVVANDVNPAGRQLCESWHSKGFNVEFYQQDVGDLDKLPAMVDFAMQTFGRLDILVNNAGIEFPRSVFGRIVNISSPQGFHGAAETAHYNAAKAA